MHGTLIDDEVIENLDPRTFENMLTEGRGVESFRYANFSIARRRQSKKLAYPQITIKKSRALDKLKKEYAAALKRIINSVRLSRRLSIDAVRAGETTIRKYYVRAYLMGLAAGGVRISNFGVTNRQDREYMERIISQEMEYWRKFVAQVDVSRMPIDRRINMYAEGLTAIYGTGRLNTVPRNTLIFWDGVNDNNTCDSCRYMFAHNPYTPKNLPTLPKSGLTLCLCLTNCYCNVLTNRGIISLKDVVVGDFVFTHKSKWQRVIKKHKHFSLPEHRYAILVGAGGKLIGITSDHLVRVNNQWKIVREVTDEEKIKMCSLWKRSRQRQSVGIMQELRDEASVEEERKHNKKKYKRRRVTTTQVLRRYYVGFLHGCEKGWQKAVLLLGRQEKKTMLYLSLSLALAADSRQNTKRLCGAPQEWRPDGRPNREFRTTATCSAFAFTCKRKKIRFTQNLRALWRRIQSSVSFLIKFITKKILFGSLQGRSTKEPKNSKLSGLRKEVQETPKRNRKGTKTETQECFLLSDLLQREQAERNEDTCVQLLRKEVQETRIGNKKVEVGQVLLLSGTLPVGTPLYDLTIEDDRSFVVEGLVLHNSNCRDKLVVIQGDQFQSLIDDSNKTPKSTHLSGLKSILRRHGRI